MLEKDEYINMRNIMKVLLISPTAPIGGIASWTNMVLNSCYKDNYILVDTKKKGNHILKNIYDLYLTLVIFFKCIFYSNFIKAHINSSCSLFGMIRELLWIIGLKIRHKEIIMQYHCDVSKFCNQGIKRWLFTRLISVADVNLVLNKQSFDFILKIREVKVIYFPNFIDEEEIVSYEYSISPKIKKIIYIGRVSLEKGIAVISELAELLPNIEFEIVGPIEEMVDFKSKNVTFTGPIKRERIIKKFRNADLFIFPSYAEGFPVVFLEAMLSGIPILTNNVGPASYLFDEFEIFNNNDTNELLYKINRLENKELRNKISKKNYNNVITNYTSTKCLKTLFNEIYKL